MPTTDGKIAALTLESLSRSGIRFALLHGEGKITKEGLISDIDVIVDRHVDKALVAAIPAFAEDGLFPIVAWPYDVGALTLFVVTERAQGGVQLDFMFDPEGHGKRHVRSKPMLEAMVPGQRWPVLQTVDELLYLMMKRVEKGQIDLLTEVLNQIRRRPRKEVVTRVSQVIGPAATGIAMKLIDSGLNEARYQRSLSHSLRTASRYTYRLLHPVGYWIHLHDHDEVDRIAAEIAKRFEQVLVSARSVPEPTSRYDFPRWWTREIAPMRWRPSLVVSWSSGPRTMPADLTVPIKGQEINSTIETLVRKAVDAMTKRLVARYS